MTKLREGLIAMVVGAGLAFPLLIVAEQGDEWYQGEIPDAEAHHPNLTVRRMPGPHHIHLEPDYVDQVAAFTREFLDL